MRRILSFAVALAMMVPAFASVAEAAVGTWLSPAPGQVVSGGKVEVAVGYNTESSVKVTQLELYVDGKLDVTKHLIEPTSRGVCSFWWDTANVGGGTHDLLVKIYAGKKMISTVSGAGTVSGRGGSFNGIDMEPPTVKFANIKSGDVLKGKTNVKLIAYDNSGQPPLVSLLVDDVLKLLRNTPPYNYDLETTTYPDGSHQIKTFAYDNAGNKSDPAVLSVNFKNGASRPVVASLSVEHAASATSGKIRAEESAPIAAPVPASSVKVRTAARASDITEERTFSSHPIAAARTAEPRIRTASVEPVIRTSTVSSGAMKAAPAAPEIRIALLEPKAKTLSAAPVAKSRPAPGIAGPRDLTVAYAPADLHSGRTKPHSEVSLPRIAEPTVMESPRAAGVRSVSASRLPETKPFSGAMSSVSARAAEPKTSEVKQVAIVPSVDSHSADFAGIAESLPADAPRESIEEPITSDTRNVAVEKPAAGVKSLSVAYSARERLRQASPSSADPDSASVSRPRDMRVAMAPNLKETGVRACPSDGVACPPAPPRSYKARIEKTTVPSSGKIKARDLFNKLGGVLFWDPSTHTVTAFVSNLKIEMKIGSKKLKVNGVAMHVAVAPLLIKGRTVIDADIYHQALAFAETLGHTAMLQSRGQTVCADGQLTLF